TPFEKHNITTHFLIAGSFKLFGFTEFSARLPFALIGSLIPLVVFLLTQLFTDNITGIAAALFATFSYFEITWSRQARGYVLIQLLILLTTLFYFKMLQDKKQKYS